MNEVGMKSFKISKKCVIVQENIQYLCGFFGHGDVKVTGTLLFKL